MSKGETASKGSLFAWPFRRKNTDDGLPQVHLDRNGGMYVDPDKLAASKAFRDCLKDAADVKLQPVDKNDTARRE